MLLVATPACLQQSGLPPPCLEKQWVLFVCLLLFCLMIRHQMILIELPVLGFLESVFITEIVRLLSPLLFENFRGIHWALVHVL